MKDLRAQFIPTESRPNLQVHWKLPTVLVQSEVEMLQLCVPQFAGIPRHSSHASTETKIRVFHSIEGVYDSIYISPK